jgi:hypothetical protein
VDHDVRGRANFVEWTTYVDDDGTENRTSADLSWYFRGAWHWDAQNFKLTMQGAPGDNEVAGGTTPLTFDLNPSTDPDITITGFDKVTAPNSIDFVDVHIFGNFPLAGTGCEYQAYLVAGTADSSGDPTDGLDGDFYAALGANRIDQNTLLARFPMKRQGEITTTPLPIPAKTYQIKVVQGTKYAQKGDFTVTENPFTQWKFVGFKSDGIHVTVVALSFDAVGNVVSRPGGSRPTFQAIAGVQLSPFDNYGRYGEYWGRALVFNLGQSGPVTIQVSGGGGTPDTQIFIIP